MNVAASTSYPPNYQPRVSLLRLVYRAIFVDHDDQPEDRAVWCAATEEEQLQAEREVRAQFAKSADDGRLTKDYARACLASLAW